MSELSGRASLGVLRAVNEWCQKIDAIRGCRKIADSGEDVLRVISNHLDLPMDDAESLDFLRVALRDAANELDNRPWNTRQEKGK